MFARPACVEAAVRRYAQSNELAIESRSRFHQHASCAIFTAPLPADSFPMTKLMGVLFETEDDSVLRALDRKTLSEL